MPADRCHQREFLLKCAATGSGGEAVLAAIGYLNLARTATAISTPEWIV